MTVCHSDDFTQLGCIMHNQTSFFSSKRKYASTFGSVLKTTWLVTGGTVAMRYLYQSGAHYGGCGRGNFNMFER